MSWRERFGGTDERAEVAARARALLSASGAASRAAPAMSQPAPRSPASWAVEPEPAPPSSARGGWVPGGGSAGRYAEPDADHPPVGEIAPIDDGRGRHAARRSPWPASPEPVPDPPVASGWRERIRFDPGRRGLVAVAAVVVVVGSVAGGVVFRGGSSSAVTVAAASGTSGASAAPIAVASSTSPPPSAAGTATATATAPGAAGSTVTVDVAGLVARPGVYTLTSGSRVEDALTLAGGPLPGADLATVNRARVLVDGEQLAVGVPGAVAPLSPAGGVGATAAGGVVDLNTAGLAELDTLPGVGPVLAQAILDYRTDHGRFDSVDQLQQVSGIGPSKFADVKDLVTV